MKRTLLISLAFTALITGCTKGTTSATRPQAKQTTTEKSLEQRMPEYATVKESTTDQAASCSEPFNGRIMRVTELVRDYVANPIAFEANYKDKCVAMWGRVTDMGTGDNYLITLAPSDPSKVKPEGDDSFARYTVTPNISENAPQVLVSVSKDNLAGLSDITVGRSNRSFLGRITGIVDNVSISVDDGKPYDGKPEEVETCFQGMENVFRNSKPGEFITYEFLPQIDECSFLRS